VSLTRQEIAGTVRLVLLDYPVMNDGNADTDPPAEYVHDPTKLEVLARLVDTACEGVSDIHDVGQRIGNLTAADVTDAGVLTVRILACTFHYMLSVNELGSPQPGAKLSPEDDERSLYPPALKQMGDQVRALWLDLAGAVTHPIALARCRDIVFTLRLDGRNSHNHAQTAARAYLACVGGAYVPASRATAFCVRSRSLDRWA
jgi:hypothetical protein